MAAPRHIRHRHRDDCGPTQRPQDGLRRECQSRDRGKSFCWSAAVVHQPDRAYTAASTDMALVFPDTSKSPGAVPRRRLHGRSLFRGKHLFLDVGITGLASITTVVLLFQQTELHRWPSVPPKIEYRQHPLRAVQVTSGCFMVDVDTPITQEPRIQFDPREVLGGYYTKFWDAPAAPVIDGLFGEVITPPASTAIAR